MLPKKLFRGYARCCYSVALVSCTSGTADDVAEKHASLEGSSQQSALLKRDVEDPPWWPQRADSEAAALGHGLLRRDDRQGDSTEELRIWAYWKGEAYVRMQKSGDVVHHTLVHSRGPNSSTEGCLRTAKYQPFGIIACVKMSSNGSDVEPFTRLRDGLAEIVPTTKSNGYGDGFFVVVEYRHGNAYWTTRLDEGADPRLRTAKNTSKSDNPADWLLSYLEMREKE